MRIPGPRHCATSVSTVLSSVYRIERRCHRSAALPCACPAGSRPPSIIVQPDNNLADGMGPIARETSIRANRALAQAQGDHESRVAVNVSVDRSANECQDLEAYISSLDEAARQPISAHRQDRIRSVRKGARNRQFALHCQ